MQDTITQDVQENAVANVNQVANAQTNVQPAPFNEKIFNQITDIIKKDKYTAQMIKQASLRWGDVENPELSQMQVIGKIAEYFQSNPKEKIDVQTVSALANMVKAGGLDFSVTNPKMKNLLALSKVSVVNDRKSMETTGILHELKNLAVNSVRAVSNTVGATADIIEGGGKFAKASLYAGANIVKGAGVAGRGALEGFGMASKGIGEGIGEASRGAGTFADKTMRGAGELFLGFGEGGASMARGAGKFVERGGEGLGNMVLGAGKLVEGAGKGGGKALHGVGSMVENTAVGAGTFAKQTLESGAQIVKSGGELASAAIDTATTGVNIANNTLKMAEAGTAKLVNRFGGNGVIGGGKNGGSLNVGNLQDEKEETKSDFKTRMMEGLSKTTDNIPMQKASGSLLSDNQKKEIKSPKIKEAPDVIGKSFGRL